MLSLLSVLGARATGVSPASTLFYTRFKPIAYSSYFKMLGKSLASLITLALTLAVSVDARATQFSKEDSFVIRRDTQSDRVNVAEPRSASGEPLLNARYDIESRANGFDYGSQKVRGVNIGGWLLAEPFIKPSLFDNTGDDRVVDEYTMGQYVGDACSRLSSHWNSWITYDDFQQIKNAGLNHVRIPIGYWAFDDKHASYCKGNQFEHLTQAVGWAKSLGLKVLVDLHGAPFSQNGFDNSGHRGTVGWFNKQDYATRAKNAVSAMAQRFTTSEYAGTVTAIELLNEPLTTSGPGNALEFTKSYYQDAYYAVRYAQGSNPTDVAVVIHDGFQELSAWNGFMQPQQFQDVILDHHQYSVFDNGQLAMGQQDRLNFYCQWRGKIGASQPNLYTIVGEWSNAPTDCAKYLNGRGIGARYDGSYPGSSYIGSCNGKTGNGANFSSSFKSQLKQLFDTQRSVYETGSGWIYWTWKTENAAEWSYQDGLKYGWITRNLNSKGNVGC
ncbi:unnamed protein product [Sympodiomycopsis kandeliae]